MKDLNEKNLMDDMFLCINLFDLKLFEIEINRYLSYFSWLAFIMPAKAKRVHDHNDNIYFLGEKKIQNLKSLRETPCNV